MTEARHQFTQPKNDQSLPIDAISFLELEITGLCQLPVDTATPTAVPKTITAP